MNPGGFGRPSFVFPSHPDQLNIIQQVIQGIGSVPKLMLPPHPRTHRKEEEFIHIRTGGDQEVWITGGGFEPPSPKKPSSVQTTSSIVSFRQLPGSSSPREKATVVMVPSCTVSRKTSDIFPNARQESSRYTDSSFVFRSRNTSASDRFQQLASF